jgi:hypothetical protein
MSESDNESIIAQGDKKALPVQDQQGSPLIFVNQGKEPHVFV